MLRRILNSTEDVCEAELTWGSFSECGNMPLSVILLLFVSAGWGALFLWTGARRLKHSMGSTRNMVVAKKMQHLQAWFYSYFHTMVYLTSLFSVGSLVQTENYVSAGAIVLLMLFNGLFSSQVDVIGSENRKPGMNDLSFTVMADYFLTTHLAKVVYKTSGHREFDDDTRRKQSTFSRLCCMSQVDNTISPKVYDIKDVVGFQGAFVALPALFVYVLTYVRENDTVTAAGSEFDSVVFQSFDFNFLLALSASVAFFSAMLPPMLGDWETYAKNIVFCLGSVVLRGLEIIARLGFYVYFIDFSRYIGFLLMGSEALLMVLTNISTRDTSSAGRTGSFSHFMLSAWESIFFTNYRRISVDKEYVTHNTLMPTAIEFVRFIGRTSATLIGYIIMGAGNLPTNYVEAVDAVATMPAFFFAGVAANILVLAFNLVNFLGVNRKDIKSADLGRLFGYWKSLGPCRFLCPSGTVHLNRDDNTGGIHYI